MKQVLIVDDELNIRENFKEYFAYDEDYKISCAESGEDAIQQIKDNPPDLIILDWWLKSDIEGKDVLVFLKENYPEIPVYAVTAARDSLEEINSLGVKKCFLKPCPELFDKIKSAFSSIPPK